MMRGMDYDSNTLMNIATRMRRNVIDICSQRGGYAGQGVALADLGACLYFNELRFDESGRLHDIFINSNGHLSIMDYSAFEILGLYTIEDLRTYNADGTTVDASPVEGQRGFVITMGSLGQGPSQAAGIAFAERLKESGKRVYCLLSDGELQEGNVWEAAMFAGHQRLDNLLWIVDLNNLQAGGQMKNILDIEPVDAKLKAFGFHTLTINGNSVPDILDAFKIARTWQEQPGAIICRTRLFEGCNYLQERYPEGHYVAGSEQDWKCAIAEIDGKLEQLPALGMNSVRRFIIE